MIKNAKGNVIELQYNGNGQVLLTVHKSVASYKVAKAVKVGNSIDETTIDRLNIYIGTALEDAKKTATSGTLTMQQKEAELLQVLVLSKLDTNYKEMQRTKFDISDWKAYTIV